MTVEADLATVANLLAGSDSIRVQLRMGQGLDESAFAVLVEAIERLIEHYASVPSVPKELALAFVDVTNSFTFNDGAYPEAERNRIEDAGHTLSYLSEQLFSE